MNNKELEERLKKIESNITTLYIAISIMAIVLFISAVIAKS